MSQRRRHHGQVHGEQPLREQVVEVGRWIHGRGWNAAGDGNISVRLDDARFLVTPTGTNKGRLDVDDLVVVNAAGDVLEGAGRPSGELLMHLAVYAAREDVRAVVHAHPPTCIALTMVGVSMAEPVLPEVVLDLGSVGTVPYVTPATPELAEAVGPWLMDFRALLLERHGSLTCGVSLLQAYDRLERLEHAATVLHRARQLGSVTTLTEQQVKQLQSLVGAPAPRRSP